MKKTINGLTKDFEEQIRRSINESGLPACVVRLVLANILEQVRRAEEQAAAAVVEEESDTAPDPLPDESVQEG